MAHVTVGDKENVERAIKRFKKKVDEEGIIKDYRDRQYFKKPSEKKREKKKESIRKHKVKVMKDEQKRDRIK